MPITSRPCRGARPTSRMPSGPPTWCATAWSSRASCHPPPIRDLRDLVRLRRSLSEALATEQNRTLKLLESANIKLASVVSQVFGVSGRAMLKALIENTATPQEMADLAKRGLRHKLEPWRWTAGSASITATFHLRRLEAIEADLRALDERIEEKARPYAAQRR